jgi:putative hemolysin
VQTLSLVKAYQARLQGQDDEHVGERQDLHQRMLRMAEDQAQLQQILLAKPMPAAHVDVETQTTWASGLGGVEGARDVCVQAGGNAASSQTRDTGVQINLATAESRPPPLPLPAAPSIPAQNSGPALRRPSSPDPVLNARKAVAQLASLAQELCTQQTSQVSAVTAPGAAPPSSSMAASQGSREPPPPPPKHEASPPEAAVDRGVPRPPRHDDSRRLEHSLLPPPQSGGAAAAMPPPPTAAAAAALGGGAHATPEQWCASRTRLTG